MTATLKEVFEFALNNRGKKTFLDMLGEEVCSRIYVHFMNGHAFCNTNKEGKVDGLILFIPSYRARILYISHILCTSAQALKNFLGVFDKAYKGFKLCAKRKGKLVVYKTESLVKKLNNKFATTYFYV